MNTELIIAIITVIVGVFLSLHKLRIINLGLPLNGKDRRRNNSRNHGVCPVHGELVMRLDNVTGALEKGDERFQKVEEKLGSIAVDIGVLLDRTNPQR